MTVRLPRRGISSLWVAIFGLVLVGFVAIAVDTAHVLLAAHQLQVAVDAAALAGAQKVRLDPVLAHQAAINIAYENRATGQRVILAPNPANDPAGDVVIGRYHSDTGEFVPTLTKPNAVKAVARRTEGSPGGPVSLFFGPAFRVNSANVSRCAIATTGGGTGAGLIALDPSAPKSLHVRGDGILRVNDGAIQVNSSHSEAAYANGTPQIIGPDLNVYGNYKFVGGATFTGEFHVGARPIPDPLMGLPPPTWDAAADLGKVSLLGGETVRIGPGYYSGGISANSGSLTMAPGIYIVGGAGFNITGNASLLAEGVMIYVIGTGKVDLTGTGQVRLTPPDPNLYDYPGVNLYEGVSIFQARNNTQEARITGTNLMDLEGTLYFRRAHVKLSGTGDGFGNQLICNTVEVSGTGDITINYDGRFPAPGLRSWLIR